MYIILYHTRRNTCYIFFYRMSTLISAIAWVRRGASAGQPSKYVLDDAELERVSGLARIELEDARTELERAHEAAKTMGQDDDDDNDDDNWVECVFISDQGAAAHRSSEVVDAMDVDEAPAKSSQDDDLAKYNLDDYDNEAKSDGELGFGTCNSSYKRHKPLGLSAI